MTSIEYMILANQLVMLEVIQAMLERDADHPVMGKLLDKVMARRHTTDEELRLWIVSSMSE